MKNILILILSISFLISIGAEEQPYNFDISGSIKDGSPLICDKIPVLHDTDFVLGNLTISLDDNSYFDEDIVVCIQANPLPLPSFGRYNSCSFHFFFKAHKNPNTTTSTTGHATTGHHTSSTTGHHTTGNHTSSTTGHHTTGNHTSSTTGPGFKKRFIGGKFSKVRDTQSFTFQLLSRSYFAAAYYKDPFAKNHKGISVTFHVTGKFCKKSTGENCDIAVDPLPDKNTTLTKTSYFDFDVTSNHSLGVLNTVEISLQATEAVKVYARLNGIPSPEVNDFAGDTKLTLISPQTGKWVLMVEVVNETIIYPKTISNYCKDKTAGKDCKENVIEFKKPSYEHTLIKAKDMDLYVFKNVTYNTLFVSIHDDANKVSIYASFNRVPEFNSKGNVIADISHCNNLYCGVVQSINAANSSFNETGDWYVAVVAGKDNIHYYLWDKTVCPESCGSHGKCQTSGENYGVCACNNGFEGVLCSPNNMLIEYIILIIIAALVLISALLGLIAWAYMRRRSQYTQV